MSDKITYAEIIQEGWPELPEEFWWEALVCLTPCPAGTCEQIIEALREYRSRSYNDYEVAKKMAAQDMEELLS